MRHLAALLLVLLTLPLAAQMTSDVLVISQFGPPVPVPAGDSFNIVVTLTNEGPASVANVRVNVHLDGGTLVDVFFEAGDRCATNGTSATCDAGTLADDQTRYIHVQGRLPLAAGTHRLTTTATVDPSDRNPANNSASSVFESVQMTELYTSIDPAQTRVEPGASVKLAARIANVHPSLPGTRFTAHFEAINATIEQIGGNGSTIWSCTTNGTTADCTTTVTDLSCCLNDQIGITLRTPSDRNGAPSRLRLTASADAPPPNRPDTTEAVIDRYRYLTVTTTADGGPGSLRQAILDVNASCTTNPCKIEFDLLERPATLLLDAPLPPITADRVRIEAPLSTAGPAVILDGRVAGEGLEIHSACDGVVRGLGFTNFYTNQGLWHTRSRDCETFQSSHDQMAVEYNHFYANLRGLRLDGTGFTRVRGNVIRDNAFSGVWMWSGVAQLTENLVSNNGASGFFFGPDVLYADTTANTITGSRHAGIAVAYGARGIDIRHNRMRDNAGLGIDWGIDGITPQREDDLDTGNAPVVVQATYDPVTNKTVAWLRVRTQFLRGYGRGYVVVELFANDSPDGDGEVPIFSTTAANTDGDAFRVEIPGDYTGKWLNATATRAVLLFLKPNSTTGDLAMTSEFSNTVLVTR